MMYPGCQAVLLTGVYGAGKTTLVEEVASVCEERALPYAAIDLDWLGWFDVGWDDNVAEFTVLIENLRMVIGRFVLAGARHFVLAQSIEHAAELDAVRAALAMPLRVVWLEVDLHTIRDRCATDPTSSRAVDLEWAGRWLAQGTGTGFEDFTVTNDRPVREVAVELLRRLGW